MAKVQWSFSALNKFETCPYQYYHQKVTKKYKDEMSAAGLWGDRVHKALDKRISKKEPLPDGMQQFDKYAEKFDTAPGDVYAERQIALTEDLQPTKWFAKDVWVRVILDVSVINGPMASVFDWKTGKRKFDIDQLKLFAGTLMAVHPEVQTVSTGYIWLPDEKIDREAFTRDDVPAIWQHFEHKVQRLQEAKDNNRWPKKPSGLCRAWCNVLDCEFNGRNPDL